MTDDDILAAAREGFLEEADQLLQQFEESLLGLESDPQDFELLNAAFRAAHTIKGTAGLFGCDAVVGFTHEVETLMEALRSGELAVSEAIFAALLQARDQMGRLLEEVRADRGTLELCDADVQAMSQRQADELRALMGLAPLGAATHDGAPDTPVAPAAGAGLWHLSLRFGGDALRNGLDPLSFIRYLDTVGTVAAIDTVCDSLPELAELDPEHCHLGFEIRLASSADRQAIEQVFEFVLDDCSLQLLAPDASAADYDRLLDQRSGGDADAREALLQRWLAQGVPLALRPAVPAAAANALPPTGSNPAADTPDLPPESAPVVAIERRDGERERRKESERRAGAKDRRGDDTRFLRVSADKLDHLIDLIGELVIAGSGAELVAQREQSPAFMEAALRIHDLVQEARDGALGLRMVPIGETFARFQRVVRDVSKALGKDVELEITGGDTEMDKSMVEAIADPLMHLVRNSLDHGIEGGDERAASGKNPRGKLALNAYHESGQIVIEVSDDGRGLARERILAKAIERGLIDGDTVLTDAEVNLLIFAPGFSTAEKVTDISGRGVGMDVVKRNIDALRGHIQIASTVGRGTTMQIRLPLTLAIIDGFLTSIGDVHYVVPLEGVVECIETPPACRAGASGGVGPRLSGCFDLRGEVLPYVDLRTCFQLRSAPPARQSMLLVRTATSKVGLLVDRLLGEHQTVLKPLGRVFQQLPGIAGSTILGSGEVALVLDIPSLMSHVTPPVQRGGAHHPQTTH
ncbi:CheA signal transduction histidine kinase [Leptothrix cholodnii SP-6]|uniref:Chemotaxis protein CheA n=1 Tax=Leptothrix cholodnii (strain ATCC 51168 / LMG 8142 / SP-6) TaxID=395495 RepID=B1XWD3_LEPCP|nr:chemotaxis protein CheA [Leptothrix cholodnii]ACB33801.1 CheA signal transduction histidine kinase [Leptothrix cholodnii SP-6]